MTVSQMVVRRYLWENNAFTAGNTLTVFIKRDPGFMIIITL
jgi:hypothetical protein